MDPAKKSNSNCKICCTESQKHTAHQNLQHTNLRSTQMAQVHPDLVRKVRDQVFSDLNAELPAVLKTSTRDGDCPLVGDLRISPTMVGPLAPMFKSIRVQIHLGFAEATEYRLETAVLMYRYTYEHPSGSNGYTVRKEITL